MSQTQSASYFSGLRDDLTGLAIDLIRARHVDTEMRDDDRNIPDQADQRTGLGGQSAYQAAPGGVPLGTWFLIAGAVVAGVVVFKKFL